MKVIWLNDALCLRPDTDDERASLATLLASLSKGDLVPEGESQRGPEQGSNRGGPRS